MRRSLHFFATKQDILKALGAIELHLNIHYVLAGEVPASDEPQTWASADEIPWLGIAKAGDQSHEPTLLLMPPSHPTRLRSVLLKRGGQRLVVDQVENPSSLALSPGGVFEPGVIIAGSLGTVSEDVWSTQAYSVACRVIRERFEQVRSFSVGPEAAEELSDGARLTARIRSSTKYDLARS
jgi:hypothetical protein